jgi:hypothetical protein
MIEPGLRLRCVAGAAARSAERRARADELGAVLEAQLLGWRPSGLPTLRQPLDA